MKNVNRRGFIQQAGLSVLGLTLGGCSGICSCGKNAQLQQPNFIVILTDDQGYGDLGCYGAKGFETPNIDRMAKFGTLFTDFYVGAPLCTPSRAALLTGCYPQRVQMGRNVNATYTYGLNPDEQTIAEILKPKGYATMCIGKWHLGHEKPFLPTNQGFDEFWGLPYSNDMKPESAKIYPQWAEIIETWPPLSLMHNEEKIEEDPDQDKLTTFYTEKSLEFIRDNKDKPFFLYLAHAMPHVPLAVSDKFRGKSKLGLYGDVIMEIDWSVGQILKTLKKLKIDKKTLVIFISDNGPWLVMGKHAGSAGNLREGKDTTFEGGQRIPCLMHMPGTIPAGRVCDEPLVSMDLLPTIATMADVPMPKKKIDGKDITGLIKGKADAKSPHEAIFFYHHEELQAVRSGRWKLHVPHDYNAVKVPGKNGMYGKNEKKTIALALFDLKTDPAETSNVADKHPKVVKRLMGYIKQMRTELGDSALKIEGSEVRPHGVLQDKGTI